MDRFEGSDNRVYMKVKGSRVEGMMVVGSRTVMYRDDRGKCVDISPLCVVDFYVHDRLQRRGIGIGIFSKMMKSEKIAVNKIAYDRPSPAILQFVSKYFDLWKHTQQSSGVLVYDAYFTVHTYDYRTMFTRTL